MNRWYIITNGLASSRQWIKRSLGPLLDNKEVVYLFYRHHRKNYAYWLLRLGLLPVAWAAQQHSVGQEKPTIICSKPVRSITPASEQRLGFYCWGKPSAFHTPRLRFHDVILSVMWSETVGFRSRPVWDKKNRSWSCCCTLWSWSCRSGVVLWNTVLLRSSS